MYVPRHFQVTDKDEIWSFIKANAFGQLISMSAGKLSSSHIPFLSSNDGRSLSCHLAKSNSQWKDIANQEVLVTFQGPHDYISPSWYETAGVPTWNYQAVHVYGIAKIVQSTDELNLIVNELTNTYESSFSKPWQPEFKASLLAAIVGIKIEITDIQGKYKLSQNRPECDRERAIKELELAGSVSLAKAMKNEL